MARVHLQKKQETHRRTVQARGAARSYDQRARAHVGRVGLEQANMSVNEPNDAHRARLDDARLPGMHWR